MSLLTKKTPWIAVSLLTAASIFGQSSRRDNSNQKTFDQGHEVGNMQMMSGYNAPARFDVRGAWDFYVSGTFLYWQPIQENMELGITTNISDNIPGGYTVDSFNGNIVNMDFDYKPAFKVGVGMNFDFDDWDSFLEYTWFRGNHSRTTSLDPNAAFSVMVLIPMWGHPDLISNSHRYLYGKEKWSLGMDLLDWDLARSEYVGKNLTFRPFFGARAAWIRQRADIAYRNSQLVPDTNAIYTIIQKSSSWGVGPKAGLSSNWMLGEGFRLFGKGSGDILFTEYTTLSIKERHRIAGGTPVLGGNDGRQTDLKCLRTHLELELGLGWNAYFDNNNWHVDIAAGYGFQVFFDQNMFRRFVDDTSVATSHSPNGNLYVHGLDLTARFDF